MSWQTQTPIWSTVDGTVSLASSQSVTASGTIGSAVTVGRGGFWVEFTVSGYVGESAFDTINLEIEANSLAATTTWTKIGGICLGDATALGVALTSLTNAMVGCYNFSDNQIRLHAYVNGSAVECTVTCNLHPMS